MAKVSIIVLQFNQSDRTLACLESLKPLNADVIVVDNNSEVQHLKNVEYWIESNKAKSYHLIPNTSNAGYSGGNNIGITQALAEGAEQILILNNDVILDEMPHGDADIIGLEQGSVFGIDYLSGAALLIKREVFETIGLFDERYFLYYEDVEFCQRARKAGFTLELGHARFQHTVSSTTKTLRKADLLYYHTRNALLLRNPRLPFGRLWTKLKQHIKIKLGREVEISKAILQGVEDYEKEIFGARIKTERPPQM